MGGPPDTVFLLVLDSLRFDRIGCTVDKAPLTPFLDSMANEGFSFEAAYAPAPWTVPVHGSLFTGDLPSYHGCNRKTMSFEHERYATLPGVLADTGYQTVGVTANPWLTPELGYDTGFEVYEYLEPTPPFEDESAVPDADLGRLTSPSSVQTITSWALEGNPLKRAVNGVWKRQLDQRFIDGRTVNNAVLQSVDWSTEDDRFVFANYMDVHDPHFDGPLGSGMDRGSTGNERGLSDVIEKIAWPLARPVSFQQEPKDPNRARQLYDDAVRRLDDILRELFDALEDRINLERTLTVIVGDHGECMGEHGYWGHGSYLHEELLRVPLIIRPPTDVDFETLRTDRPVSLVDLPRLICEAVGVELPDERAFDENSFHRECPVFAESTHPRPDETQQAASKEYRAVIYGDWKLVCDWNANLCDLQALSADANADDGEVRPQLEELLEECWRRPERRREKEDDGDLSKSTTHRLRDLGYIS